LTGDLNLFQTALYQTGSTLLTTVIGLSGSITGEGAISTALNASIQTVVVSASGAQSTQINAVSARLVQTGINNYALAGTIMDALATSGGAYGAYLTQLSAVTTGNTATVKMFMDAAVTGSVNGLGGAAQARWGFEIGADGKIASMKATVNSFQSYGTAVFGNLNLESSTFSAGISGWQITAAGDVQCNSLSARGAFTGGAGTSQIAVDPLGLRLGNFAGDYISIQAGLARHQLLFITSDGSSSMSLGTAGAGYVDAGFINLNDDAGTNTITLQGGNGSIHCDTFSTDSTADFNGTIDIGGNGILFPNIGSGANRIAFAWDGSNVRAYVDGTLQGTIPNP
jgi:hypothetical protein